MTEQINLATLHLRKDQNASQMNLKITSSNTATSGDHLIGADLTNQQSTDSNNITIRQPSKNGIFKFLLPSEKDCNLAPEENLEPNSAGLRSSRTGGV